MNRLCFSESSYIYIYICKRKILGTWGSGEKVSKWHVSPPWTSLAFISGLHTKECRALAYIQ